LLALRSSASSRRGLGHPRADLRLGNREAQITTGATVWIPRDVSVELRNTGNEPLTLLFLFPEPDAPEELQRHLEKARPHIVFDDPPPPR
jgi:oxalate decarboxylase/phosphoglucose isomerase-like protein (cupin superfamily)